MKTSLSEETITTLTAPLQAANNAMAAKYPGESGRRQPVHTVYGGAHLFRSDSAQRLGNVARRSLQEYGPDFVTFAQAIGLPGAETLPQSEVEIARLAKAFAESSDTQRQKDKPAWMAQTI